MDNAGFSFGVIFIGNDINEDLVRHEYGHTVQFRMIGIFDYIGFVALPSVTCYLANEYGYLPQGIYYNLPWEYVADQFGGVSREYVEYADTLGTLYWGLVTLLSWVAWP